jgi:hypothetical protein
MRRFIVLALLAVPALAPAECGWLLLVPPSLTASWWPRPGGGGIQEWGFPPESAWGQHGAYDSASACEADRRALVRWRTNEVHDPDVAMDRVRRGEYGALSLAEQAYARVVWARCLPASQVPVR